MTMAFQTLDPASTTKEKSGKKPVLPMQAYQRHITSDFLSDRYPYLEDIRGHLRKDDVTMAFGDRLFPRIVEQLQSDSMVPEKLVEALRTVCDLCAHQENKCQAIASDVVAAATNLLVHDDVPVRREAARVIGSMALVMGGRNLMPQGSSNMSRKLMSTMESGSTLPRLSKLLLSCPDELVKMHVAKAMRSITVFRDGCQQMVDQGTVKGVAQYLCATLPDLPTSPELGLCLLHLLYTLGAITMYARDGMRDLFGIRLLAKVIAFLDHVPKDKGVPAVTPEDSADTLRQALRLLWHTGNDPRGRGETLKAEGVRTITGYLGCADVKIREAAVCALNVASLETQGKKDILEHSLENLALILHSEEETPYLHETCVQLCRCASELPAFRWAFARHVLESVWLLEKIFGTTALAAVSPLLDKGEPQEIRERAAGVLTHFVQQASPCEGDKIRVPPVTPLQHIEEPQLFALEECRDILHNLVDLLSDSPKAALECLGAILQVEKTKSQLRELIDTGRVAVPEASKSDIDMLLLQDATSSS